MLYVLFSNYGLFGKFARPIQFNADDSRILDVTGIFGSIIIVRNTAYPSITVSLLLIVVNYIQL